MSIFAKVTEPSKPKTANIFPLSLAYATVLVIVAVAQLFSFNDFQSLIDSFWLPGGSPTAYFLSGLIVVAEVFALPFLLRMKISPLMRYLSMGLGWFVPVFWLGISLWLVVTTNAINNVGILGTVVKLAPGWWMVFISLALIIAAIWISWGMWPQAKRAHK